MKRAGVQIVGGGRMGEALLGGLRAARPDRSVRVVEALPARAEELRAAHPGLEVTDRPGPAEGTVVAVKPHQVSDAARAIGGADGGRILSIAAGVTTIVQPGGSIRDDEVFAACDAAGVAMVVTGRRHFRH